MPTTRTPIVALLAAILLVAAACGSSADTSSATSETAELPTLESESDPESPTDAGDDTAISDDDEEELVDPDVAMAEYERCLADKGVELPSASDGGSSILQFDADDDAAGGFDDPEAFEAAFEECGEILNSAFGEFELTPDQEAEMADQMLEMQRCLSDRGFDIDFGDGNGSFELDASIDFDEFDAAMQDCSPEGVVGGAELETVG